MRPVYSFLKRVVIAALICLVRGGLILSTPLAAWNLFDGLQIYPLLSQSELNLLADGPPAAITLLSGGRRLASPEFGGQFGDEMLDALSLERVRYGAYLGRKTGLPILVSGGLPALGEGSLASLMAGTLSIDCGIRAKWLRSRSDNTAENAIYSTKLLKQPA